MVVATKEQIEKIGQVLCDISRPLKERFRALFTLKNIGGAQSIQCFEEAFKDSSALLKHELAYCLGQMQDKDAIPILIQVLENELQESIVRHEAAEALGAIGDANVKQILEKYLQDPVKEVSETCELALDRMKWLQNPDNHNSTLKSAYFSVDPAPPATSTDIKTLKDILMNDGASLFDRYRAMFSLRNLRSQEATVALGEALFYGSALFRHEIAFVLGQLQEECSVPFLKKSLSDVNENEMVRHECAEALGAIATKDCFDILKKYLHDEKRVVKESCEIALDMCEYENSPEFQYANALQTNS